MVVRCRSVRELGEKWFWQEMVVRCRSVRELGGLLVFRETERGENFLGEMVLVPETRDIGFKFFLIKCHCHVGKWLMKDGQKAPL
jgi:hypothetical protein